MSRPSLTEQGARAQTFASVQTRTVELLRELARIVEVTTQGPSAAMQDLLDRTRTPLFTLAVTGPSRVGKSTLINAFLRRELCPMGDFPKTAFPARFEPGKEDRLTVSFNDRPDEEAPPTAAALEQFVSWDHNADNNKGVRGVVVELDNPAIDLGFAILDLPGLDDPNDAVRTVTELALEDADAILYVVNGALMASGSFMFTRSDKEQLSSLLSRKDKVFLVVNKAEQLSTDQRDRLQSFLRGQFERYDLDALKDGPIAFVSALDSYLRRCRGDAARSDSTLVSLEDGVYRYLLHHSEVGRNRLKGLIGVATQIAREQLGIVSLSLSKIEEAESLRRFLGTFETLRQEVQASCQAGAAESASLIRTELFEYRRRASRRFAQALTDIPLVTPLPDRQEVRAWLNAEVARMAAQGKGQAQAAFQSRSATIAGRVQTVMNSLMNEVQSLEGSSSQLQIGGLGQPVELNLWSPFWGTLGLGLVGLIFGPVGAIVGAIAGFFIGLFIGEQQRRQKEIRKLREAVDSALDSAAGTLSSQLGEAVSGAFADLSTGLSRRIEEARSALARQLEGLGQLPSKARQAELRRSAEELGNATVAAQKLFADIDYNPRSLP